MLKVLLRCAAAAVAAVLCAGAEPARADWLRAESANFIVYSQGDEAALRRYVRNLETFDLTLRLRMGLPLDETAARKLPIYLVHDVRELRQINPRTGESVAGTYFPVGEDIFAASLHDRDMDYLLHEYFHHFSYQMGVTSGYPGWLVEGLAEYYMTAEIGPDAVTFGGYNQGRVIGLLASDWLPLEDLLTKRFSEVERDERASYYPLSWLLTHWFMSDDARRAQLQAYLADLQRGVGSVEAMQRATGLNLAELRLQLRRYRRLPLTTYHAAFPEPAITVTRLPPSADDLLLIGQRLKVGVVESERAATAALVRRLAARHPDDPFALLQLAHGELHFGQADIGEGLLQHLVERDPANVEALQLLAARLIERAADEPEAATDHLGRARSHLARAYESDPGQYYTLHLLARSREGAPDYPTENDLATWERAFLYAPQLSAIRLGLARALMLAGEHREAVVILRPLANGAHGGRGSEIATLLMERAEAGLPPPGAGELEAAGDEDEPETAAPEPIGGGSQPDEPSDEPAA